MVGASPLDISGFNPDNFVNSMMQKLRLRDLMSAHVAMAHEVRALNSELQALVYQNYSKFLDSTDSIRVMRKELFSMGSRLRDLQGEMKRVADSSARIDARIRPRRQSVGELGEVRSVLQRLETVFALPTKLRMALDRGSLDIATGYYAAARPVLDAFGHQGGLRTVLAECRPLVDRLRRSLRARLADGEEGALDLLEKIGDDVTDLRDEMLLGMLVPVRRELKRCAKEAARLSGCAEAELLPPAAPVAAGDSFASAVKASDVPLPSGAEDLVRHMGAAVLGALTAAVNRHRTLFPVSKEDKAAAARDAGVVFPLVGCYMRQVAAIASSLAPRASVVGGKKVWEGFATPALWKLDFGTQALLNVIKQVLEDTHGCAALDALGARSSWVGASLALACARQHVASCVAFGPAATLLCLREAARPGSAVPLSADVMERCRSALRSGLEACFQSLRPVLVPTQALVGVPVPYDMPKWAAQCLSQGFADLQRHMMRMVGQGPHPEGGAMRGRDKDAASFRVQKAACLGPSSWRQGQSLVDTAAAGACGVAWELASDAARAPDAAVAALAGSRLAAGVLEQSVVARVSEALTSAAPGAAIGTGQAFDASEVSRQLGEASSRLLARWVQLRGREISAALRGSVAGVAGRAGGAPAGPSVVSSAVVEGLERAAAEVAAALPDRANRGGGSDALAAWLGPPPHVFAGAPSVVQSGNIEREMDVLFGNRIKVFGPVEAAQGSLVAAVAKIALKTLVELIRDSHVVPGAVKQLQLDLALIARSLAPMASPAGSQALKTLLDDAAGALYARGGIKAAMAREDLSAAVVRSSKPGS